MDYMRIASDSHRHLTEEITRLRAELDNLQRENTLNRAEVNKLLSELNYSEIYEGVLRDILKDTLKAKCRIYEDPYEQYERLAARALDEAQKIFHQE